MLDSTNPGYRFLCALNRDYRVRLVDGVLDPANTALAEAIDGRRALVVTTPTVYGHYGKRLIRLAEAQRLNLMCEVLALGEQRKSLASVEKICELALRHELGRSDTLIALGGGVCSDVVTLAASWIRRGVRHLRIPTTLIGQVDASIGLKGGVNFHNQKNYLGCFHPPAEVLVDPALLATLDRKALSHGFAEIVKMALICDAALLRDVQCHGRTLLSSGFREPHDAAERIIERSIRLMLEQLDENPYEDITSARLVDMGHTFSPALEAAAGFSMAHGEAVSIDMALTSLISTELGFLPESEAYAIIGTLSALDLPIWSPLLTPQLCLAGIEQMVLQRRGSLNLVALEAIGEPVFVERASRIDDHMLCRSIAALAALHDALRSEPSPNLVLNQKAYVS